jgi:RimJ/RimL family protein N-acetyltransferase
VATSPGDDQLATVAYQVFREWRGRGIAARALELVTGWALREPRWTCLMLEIEEGNTASIRVAETGRFARRATSAERVPRDAQGSKITFVRTES